MVKVSVVKCSSYKSEEVKKALEESLKLIGFEFKKNQKVLIKPNVLGPFKPEQAITTHPVIIEELCKILKKYNSKIYIGDSPSIDSEKSFEVSGIKKIADKYGNLINFDKEKKFQTDVRLKIKKIYLPDIIKNMDLIINVPKLKTHSLTNFTASVKNLYGFIPGKTKSNYHKIFQNLYKFSELLTEIHDKIKPQLNIIDGVEGIEGLGPGTSGSIIKSNLIITSKNAIALDIISSKIIGFKPNEIFTNKIAIKKGYFKEKIEVVGNGKNIKINFKKARIVNSALGIIRNLIPIPKPKIIFDYKKCIKCRRCEKICPENAIYFKSYINRNHKKCTNCFCCMEVCPENAVLIKDSEVYEILKKIYNIVKK